MRQEPAITAVAASAGVTISHDHIANDSPRAVQLKRTAAMTAASPATVRSEHAQQVADSSARATQSIQRSVVLLGAKPNNTGLPDRLKSGIESLSGMSMDHVKVHYNSARPARLHAHAYAQGSEIHLAPGQERHLPHEAWHVVQQAQGRVRPTEQTMAGAVNDDPPLEEEADMMGIRASQFEHDHVTGSPAEREHAAGPVTQHFGHFACEDGGQQTAAQMRPMHEIFPRAAPAAPMDAVTAIAAHRHCGPARAAQARIEQGKTVIQMARLKTGKRAVKRKHKIIRKKELTSSADGRPALTRLRAANRRNKKSKARPVVPRYIHGRQARFHSGYPDADVARMVATPTTEVVLYNPNFNPWIEKKYSQLDVGDVRGYFRPGFGGQPFLYLQSTKYDDKMIPSNYDDIIAHFAGQDMEVAFNILNNIEGGSDLGTNELGQAQGLMVLLTQFIEPHSSRIPGADKFARALLRRIAVGQLTFAEAFNRRNGLFVSAWAKNGGAPVGGQTAGRALFGTSKDSDKFDYSDLEEYLGEEGMNRIFETVDGYFSDDSDSEDDGEDDELMADAHVADADLGRINAALGILGFTERLNNLRDLPMLNATKVRKQYLKQVIKKHHDKGGDKDELKKLQSAKEYLAGFIGHHGSEQNKLDADNLNRNLSSEGRERVEVVGDGNCFYSAVVHQLTEYGGVAVDTSHLRTCLANLVEANKGALKLFAVGEQLQQVLTDILTSRRWNNMGGDFAPQLMATVLQRPIRIVQPSGVLSFSPNPELDIKPNCTFGGGGGALTIVYDGQGHYDSTRDIRGRLPSPSSS